MKKIKANVLIIFAILTICLCSSIPVSASATYYLLENVTYLSPSGKTVNSKRNYKYDKKNNLIQISHHYISGYDHRDVTKYKYTKKYKNGIRQEANLFLNGKNIYKEIFDKNSYVTKHIDKDGSITAFRYDKNGNTVFKSDRYNKVKFTYSYYSNGIPKKCTASNGTVIEYNKKGLVVTEKSTGFRGGSMTRTFSYTYYKNGLPKIMTVKENNRTVMKQKFTYTKTKVSRNLFLHRFYEHMDLEVSPACVQ